MPVLPDILPRLVRAPHWPRIPISRTTRLVLLSVALGVIGALGARAFMALIDLCTHLLLHGIGGFQAPTPPEEGGLPEVRGAHWRWLVPVSTTLGGLLSGLLVQKLAPEAEGHGTDAAVRAFHRQGGAVRKRIPLVKALASALTIGSGGAAGREGPTAQISSGLGSILATALRLPVADRRILVLAGIAAGVSAAFKSPLGAALFAVEVLYSNVDFEVEALVHTIVAASVAYAVNGFFAGWTPIFTIPAGLSLHRGSDLLWYGALGVLAGGVAALLPFVFYRTEAWFARLRMPRLLKPALGGLGVGLLALGLPQVLGGGYGWMQQAIDGQLPLLLLALLVLGKIVALALTIGSGGSGGVFAPALFVGCMLGSAVGLVAHQALPELGGGPPVAAMAVVGMAAVFAGAGRVPLATLVMTAELTGGYGLLVPTMLAVVVSFLLQSSLARRLHLRHPLLFHAQVPTRADSATHQAEYVHAALQILRRGQVQLDAPVSWPGLDSLLHFGQPMPIGQGGEYLFAVRIPAGSPLAGQLVRDVPFGNDVRIASLIRADRHTAPRGETELREGDELVLICHPAQLERLADLVELLTPQVASAEPPAAAPA